MSDFDDFAAGMDSDHQAKQQAHDEKMRQEALERATLRNAGKEYLIAEVLPILMEAKAAFDKLGLRTEIKPNWAEGDLHMRPEVTFQVFGQKKRPFDESTYEMSGNLASVRYDDGVLTARISNEAYSSTRSTAFEGSDLDAVREVAKRALSTLYAALDPEGR